MPWLRNILIVSNNQTPAWLNTAHPRIRVVDGNHLLKSIGGAAFNYNSHALYLALGFIEGLSEIFLQLDDDFIVTQPVPPHLYFRDFEQEVTSLSWPHKRRDLVVQTRVLRQMLPAFHPRWATHIPRCWNATRIREVVAWIPEAKKTLRSRFRSSEDIDLTSFYGPFVAAYHDSPLHFIRNDIMEGWQMTAGSHVLPRMWPADSPLHAYTTMGKICRNWPERNVTLGATSVPLAALPTFVTAQDKDGETMCNSRVFRRKFGLDAPSTFEVGFGHWADKQRMVSSGNVITVFGHRGVGPPRSGEHVHMESTLDSLYAGYQAGLRNMEIDVAISKDNVVFVSHSHARMHEDCDRAPPQPLIRDSLFEEIQAASHVPVCTLSDVLARFRHRMHFQIEVKHETNYKLAAHCNREFWDEHCWARALNPDRLVDGVLNVVEMTQFPRVNLTISSFEGPRLRNWLHSDLSRGERPTLKLVGAQSENVAEMIRAVRVWLGPKASVSVRMRWVSRGRVQQLRDAGIGVEVAMSQTVGGCLAERSKFPMVDRAAVYRVLKTRATEICGDYARDAMDLILNYTKTLGSRSNKRTD
jgi:glycerophosphoryl diester phosphodiesterase